MPQIHFTLLVSTFMLFMPMAPSTDTNAQSTAKTYLALGDSYTIGESVAESERWPVQLAAELVSAGVEMSDPKIIAKTGWRTDELMAAIENDQELAVKYDLVSLLIGVNNQYQGKSVESFALEFEQLLQTAIKLAGNNNRKVIVLSIPDYGKTPFGASKEEKIEKEIDAYNKASKDICKKYKVKYFNITPISRRAKADPELVADDDLHPSGKMYSAWVELIDHYVTRLMQ